MESLFGTEEISEYVKNMFKMISSLQWFNSTLTKPKNNKSK
jgi:hypothetical protein